MKKITKKQAMKITAELFEWVAENDVKAFSQFHKWEGWKKYKIQAGLPCCLFMEQNKLTCPECIGLDLFNPSHEIMSSPCVNHISSPLTMFNLGAGKKQDAQKTARWFRDKSEI